MYLKLYVLAYMFLGIVPTEDRWWCTTPNGEEGECIPLTACPPLMEAFANPKKGMENYLIRFKCISDEPLVVCCGLYSNFSVFGNTISVSEPLKNSTNKLQSLSDLRYCGLQRADDYFRLEDDPNKTPDEFPWAAIISILAPDPGYSSGALISNRYVMTSLADIPSFSNYEYFPVIVRLGDFFLGNETDCVKLQQFDEECSDYEEYSVEEAIRHPFFVFEHGLHYITLLRLNKSVIFSDYIRPICLPIPGTQRPKLEDTLYMTSWGFIDSQKSAAIKRKLLGNIISNEECIETGLTENAVPLTAFHMCIRVFENNSESICSDDLGLQIMYSRKHQWFLEGFGLLVQIEDCKIINPLVNTKVTPYLEWIHENIRP